jgi:pimeloyl-ACP methyl ester carboxylesterase
VNDVRLHYVIGGQGDPVVLLHGFPETWYTWHKVMPALAEEHKVIAVDLRGVGGSSLEESGYDKDTMAEDVYRLVRKLGFEEVADRLVDFLD